MLNSLLTHDVVLTHYRCWFCRQVQSSHLVPLALGRPRGRECVRVRKKGVSMSVGQYICMLVRVSHSAHLVYSIAHVTVDQVPRRPRSAVLVPTHERTQNAWGSSGGGQREVSRYGSFARRFGTVDFSRFPHVIL
jgi:hypothetical protein